MNYLINKSFINIFKFNLANQIARLQIYCKIFFIDKNKFIEDILKTSTDDSCILTSIFTIFQIFISIIIQVFVLTQT